MRDTIYREDAIEVLAINAPFMSDEAYLKSYDALKSIPSADRPQEWIPCSERLPEKDGRYLTTYPLIRDMKWVHILWYGEPSMPSRDVQGKVWYVSDEEYGDVPYEDVIAWMPLPKPYGEREGE